MWTAITSREEKGEEVKEHDEAYEERVGSLTNSTFVHIQFSRVQMRIKIILHHALRQYLQCLWHLQQSWWACLSVKCSTPVFHQTFLYLLFSASSRVRYQEIQYTVQVQLSPIVVWPRVGLYHMDCCIIYHHPKCVCIFQSYTVWQLHGISNYWSRAWSKYYTYPIMIQVSNTMA